MTYRKSKSGSEFAAISRNGFIVSFAFFQPDTPGSRGVRFTRNELDADDLLKGDQFIGCTVHEFEQAYTRAMKLIEL